MSAPSWSRVLQFENHLEQGRYELAARMLTVDDNSDDWTDLSAQEIRDINVWLALHGKRIVGDPDSWKVEQDIADPPSAA